MNGLKGMPEPEIRRAVAKLDSLIDGDAAVAVLIGNGNRSIPYLEEYLLKGKPRTVSLPRCRAVHALGELGACSALLSYFWGYALPEDAQVRFAEDAVRSAAADELLRCKSSEVFDVLLEAAKQRATSGVIVALGEFRRPEAVPLLFKMLGDDFCGLEAAAALLKVPTTAHDFAILALRNRTGLEFDGPSGLARRRAVLQLLRELKVSPDEWQELSSGLHCEDADTVIAAAAMGLESGNEDDRPTILTALYRISHHVNWAQEAEIMSLFDRCHEQACKVALAIAEKRSAAGESPVWLDPSWRILSHILGKELKQSHHAAARVESANE